MIIKADPGYSLIMMKLGEGGRQEWAEELVMRYPVIAWEFLQNGRTIPLVPFPVMNDEFVVELPSGVVIGFHREHGNGLFAEDIGAWLRLVQNTVLQNTPAQGQA